MFLFLVQSNSVYIYGIVRNFGTEDTEEPD